ncbi:MAG: DciA family protein [Patescibacteria group bacterium]|nr:DciA family protein [Patescibacteria group bacterium]
MAWESLKSIMPKAIKEAGIKDKMTSVKVLESSARILKARWGEEKAGLVEFISFTQGTLKARTSSPGAMQTLRVEQISFLNDLNRLLGEKAVKQLDIRSQSF